MPAIPSLSRELHAAGRLDHFGTTEPLTAEQRGERLPARATEVLWWDVIECDRTPDDVAAYDGDGLLRPGLVPFAGNGAGDHYSWYPAWQDGPEPPVVLVEVDVETSRVFAPDVAGCLVRCLVQHFAGHTVRRRPVPRRGHALLRPLGPVLGGARRRGPARVRRPARGGRRPPGLPHGTRRMRSSV